MTVFRIFLALIVVVCSVYTAEVVMTHDVGLYGVFFGDMAAMGWPGQFNLDFMCMLALVGLWVAWRHHFSAMGLLLGFLAANLGAPFLATYLFIAVGQAKGDMKEVLLGTARAAG